jgi:O-antigen ligase
MCTWILSIAGSATSSSCFVVGITTLLVSRLDWVKTHFRLLGWFALGIAIFLLAFTAMPEVRGALAGLLDRDVTLTGRTDIWEDVLKLGTNPLVGCGFASVWLTPGGAGLAQDLGIPHCHNGYLETYLNSGFVGVGLLLALIIAAGKVMIRELSFDTNMSNLFAAFVVTSLIYNYTEVAFNDSNIVGLGLWLVALLPCTGATWPESEQICRADARSADGQSLLGSERAVMGSEIRWEAELVLDGQVDNYGSARKWTIGHNNRSNNRQLEDYSWAWIGLSLMPSILWKR